MASGQTPPPSDNESEYLFALLDVMSDSEDPSALDRLIEFIGTGNRVINAVAAFGEDAVPRLEQLVETDTETVPALLALRRMLTVPPRSPLSEQSRRAISALALSRLSGTQQVGVVVAASELAVATGDRAGVERVRQLAADGSAVGDLGITKPGEVDLVRGRLRDALARRESAR